MDIHFKEMLNCAKEVCKHSYSPYSNFPVGACVLYENMNTYTGTNIENSSIGLTICAERAAIAAAIASGEKGKIIAIAIYSPERTHCSPCGACRQWLFEFAKDSDAKIILEDKDNELAIHTLGELLPHNFKL